MEELVNDLGTDKVIGVWGLSNFGGVSVLSLTQDEVCVRWYDEEETYVCPIEYQPKDEGTLEEEPCIVLKGYTLFLSDCMRVE